MDTRSGKIWDEDEIEKKFGGFDKMPNHFMQIMESEMTEKQKKTKQVSPRDNKSKLGKRFTAARHQRDSHFKRKTANGN